jgi:DNA adenine methylase
MSGYLGSKAASGAFQAVIGSMPPHEVYIEAFAGSGAVLRAKPDCVRSVAIDRDAAVFERFAPWPAGVELMTADAIATLAEFDYGGSPERVLVYCDPPYVHSTRSSRKGYRYEMSDGDHGRLLAVLRSLPCSVIISGYASSVYDELLVDWRRREYQVMTRGGVRTEVLWMNYEQGSSLLSRFVGRDYVDRQRIKRKASRWRSRFSAMPAGERNVVLAALLDVLD